MPTRKMKKPVKHRTSAKNTVRRPKRTARSVVRKRRRAAAPAPNLYAKYTQKARRRRRIISWVSAAMILVGLGILAYPFIPMIRYAVAKPTPVLQYESRLNGTAPAIDTTDVAAPIDRTITIGDVPVPADANANVNSNTSVSPAPAVPKLTKGTIVAPAKGQVKPKPVTNRLVIPKIGVDVEIVEGANQDVALNKGIWRIPGTSTPAKGGNTVLSGHRFRFLSGPRTLYLLDKLKKGDVIVVYWKGKEYDYKVSGSKIVTPKQVEILDNTVKPQLTIFTCSPLFSTKERLVLIAKPI